MEIKHPSSNADDVSALDEAAITGDTSVLHRLIKRDSLILKRSRLSSFGETPLHISVLAGHVDFTRELLHQDPEMAREVDSSNSTPLHLAAALGHAEIVKILLSVETDACLVRRGDGRIPLHLAVIRGRVGIVKELVQARLKSVSEDLDGYLASLPNMGGESAVNCLNGHGSTPLDCLELCHKDYNSLQIRDILVQAGSGGRSQQDQPTSSHSNLVPLPSKEAPVAARKRRKNKSCCKSMGRKLKNFLAYEGNWLEKMKKTVLLVATIIASMSFQAATNPPGGVWSENRMSPVYGALCNETNICKAGTAILAYGDEARPELLDIFVACNTVAFGASLGIMLLIVGGFPIKKNKFLTWILTQAICTVLYL
ncbi:Ankyrin repeat-containing protein ITN1 [Linum grandiflorum]